MLILIETTTSPWVTLFFIFLGFVICIFTHIYLVTRKYRCPRCAHVFRPKWNQFSIAIHNGDERVAKCPKCGRKGFCPRER